MAELAVLEKIKPVLESGKAVRSIDFDEDEMKIVRGFFLLTSKPVLYVANIAEDDMADPENSKYYKTIKDYVAKDDPEAEVLGISAETEEEIAELDDDDKKDFLEAEGIEEPGLNRLIRSSYKLLGLETFFTAGGPETRAWTFKRGMKAPQCAGIIHSDFERGFIRAETVHMLILIETVACKLFVKPENFAWKVRIMWFKMAILLNLDSMCKQS